MSDLIFTNEVEIVFGIPPEIIKFDETMYEIDLSYIYSSI